MLLPRSKGKQSVAEYGTLLNGRITVKQLKSWPKGAPAEWAVESWKLAKEYVYTEPRCRWTGIRRSSRKRT